MPTERKESLPRRRSSTSGPISQRDTPPLASGVGRKAQGFDYTPRGPGTTDCMLLSVKYRVNFSISRRMLPDNLPLTGRSGGRKSGPSRGATAVEGREIPINGGCPQLVGTSSRGNRNRTGPRRLSVDPMSERSVGPRHSMSPPGRPSTTPRSFAADRRGCRRFRGRSRPALGARPGGVDAACGPAPARASRRPAP